MIELEIEMHKVVRTDLDALMAKYPREWAECVEDAGGDEDEAVREFVAECWRADASDFDSTAFDSVEFYITKLEAETPNA